MKDNKTPARLYLSCGLRAQTHSLGQTKETTCFIGTAMSTGLRIVSGCFRDTVGELNRCDRDGMTCKAHIDCPALSRKSLPSPNRGRLPREASAQPAGCWGHHLSNHCNTSLVGAAGELWGWGAFAPWLSCLTSLLLLTFVQLHLLLLPPSPTVNCGQVWWTWGSFLRCTLTH